MNLIRCDRCRKEYKGGETYLFRPVLQPSPYRHDQGVRWDLCDDCREGLSHVYIQSDRIIRMFLNPMYLQRTHEMIVDWYRHLVTVEPVQIQKQLEAKPEDPDELARRKAERERREEEKADSIRRGCAGLLTDPTYANDQICRFCGGYRADHRIGQPGPGSRYPQRA